jgi:hypothetical protein
MIKVDGTEYQAPKFVEYPPIESADLIILVAICEQFPESLT